MRLQSSLLSNPLELPNSHPDSLNRNSKRAVRTGPPPLNPRVFALLHAVRYGRLPWLKPGQSSNFTGVVRQSPDHWVLCETHVFTDAEIASMERASWIKIEKAPNPTDQLDQRDQPCIKRGPALMAALKQAFQARTQLFSGE